MSSLKQQLAIDIAGYLSKCIENGDIPSDEQESLEVAISCIRESFGVSEDAESDGDLLSIYTQAKQAKQANGAGKSSTDAFSGASSLGNTPLDGTPAPTPVVSEESKAEAEQLKVNGNRLMAQKKYTEAIDCYTSAIAKNPANAVYYSNRAAAYSQLDKGANAVEDGRRAVSLDPTYSKAYSRLGLALWSVGDLKGSLEAYENGLKAEGDSPSEGMKRDYATVKKRYEEELANSKSVQESKSASAWDVPATASRSADGAAGASSNASGAADPMAGLGGLGGLGGIANLMKNPEIQKMAQQFMSNPSVMNDIINSPTAQKVRESFQTGKMPNMNEVMQDENIQKLMKNLGGDEKP